MSADLKDKDPLDRNDIRNYTLVENKFWAEIYKEVGNKDIILKIVDRTEDHPKYYVLTRFLIGK